MKVMPFWAANSRSESLIGREASEITVSPAVNFLNPPPVPEMPTGIWTCGCSFRKSSAAATVTGYTVEDPSMTISPESGPGCAASPLTAGRAVAAGAGASPGDAVAPATGAAPFSAGAAAAAGSDGRAVAAFSACAAGCPVAAGRAVAGCCGVWSSLLQAIITTANNMPMISRPLALARCLVN